MKRHTPDKRSRAQQSERQTPNQLTPNILKDLSERALREDVLMPLFKEMGFRDVYLNHGSTEDGKDIVMWRADVVRGRVNVAVVVKATPINGRAEGQGSAANVATQVRQCFGSLYRDPTGPGTLRVHECLVVCPHDLSPDALRALESLLPEDVYRRSVNYKCGDQLWECVDQYLGSRTVFKRLNEVAQLLDVDPQYDVAINVTQGSRVVSVTPRLMPSGELAPAPVISFDLQDSPLGAEGRQVLKEHYATGRGGKLTAEMLRSIKLPEIMRRLGFDGVGAIELAPIQIERIVNISVGPEERPIVLQSVRLTGVGGNQEVSLSSERPGAAWRLALRLRRDTGEATVSLTISGAVENVSSQCEAARIHKALAQAGVLRFEDATDGRQLLDERYHAGIVPAPEAGLLPLLEALESIQRRTGQTLSLPDRPISVAEAQETFALARALEKGRQQGTIDNVSLVLSGNAAASLKEVLSIQREWGFEVAAQEMRTICGNAVSLGWVARVVQNYTPTDEEREDLLRALLTPATGDIPVTLKQPAQCTTYFLDLERSDELDAVRRRLGVPAVRP
jgi:hypothetical protein